jgi:hypothetical protein
MAAGWSAMTITPRGVAYVGVVAPDKGATRAAARRQFAGAADEAARFVSFDASVRGDRTDG